MSKQSPPSFDDWVIYCFTRGYADFHGSARSATDDAFDAQAAADLADRMLGFDMKLLTEYLTRLFRAPKLLGIYSDDQLGDATWFLFGAGSGYFHNVCSDAVPQAEQIACYQAVPTMYADLFDRRCCRRGDDPAGSYIHDARLDGAVYMVWDMDSFEVPLFHPDRWPHLIEPIFGVLESILMSSRTSTCQISALHGLGHVQHRYPQRVVPMIDAFLQTRSPAPWVADYVRSASRGGVM